ncbi:50S ribosomal protein L25/general stress protein Ctc [Heliobacterium mobile]|nr:50S ribosomal protein L25/general stress protein Ctc [Heliobacterium mobile]
MEANQLRVSKREKGTQAYVKELRRRGLLPAVIYGKDTPDLLVSVNAKELQKLLNAKGSATAILDVAVEGGEEPKKVMVREMQRDPVARTLNHVDFQLVNMNEVISAEVTIHLVGTPVGVKAGGVIQHGLRTLEVEGLPAGLPPRIDLDVSHLDLHDKLTVADVTPPKGIDIVSDPDQVIASIVVPRAVVETTEEPATAEDPKEAEKANGAKAEEA